MRGRQNAWVQACTYLAAWLLGAGGLAPRFLAAATPPARPVVAAAPAAVAAVDALDAGVHGEIDWRGRRFVATASVLPPGNARLWADVSALAQALAEEKICQELSRQIAALPLGCGAGTPAQLLQQQPRWAAHVAAAVRHFTATATTYGADGRVSLEVFLPFDGGPARLNALWTALWRQQASLGLLRQGVLPALQTSQVSVGTRAPTGFVVQAKGLHMAPALWPRLLDAHGRELYGPGVLRADVFAARGVAPLHTSLEDALHDPRVSERALVVRAAALHRPGGSDLVLAAEDAQLLQENLPLLQDGRVAFVVD